MCGYRFVGANTSIDPYGLVKDFRQYRIILSADTASEVRQMLSFGNADAVPHTEPQRGASERNRRLRRLLARRSAGAVLKPLGGNCAVLP